jgi:hypothetical protein
MRKFLSMDLEARRRAIVLAAGLLCAMGAGATEPANWQEQDIVIDYQGFTTHYSCDGLRDRVRSVLLRLGARPDLTVTSSGCVRLNGPERFPSVHAHFSSLHPAAAPAPGIGDWKSLNLGGVQGLDPGECELAEEVVRTILPHFAVRNAAPSPRCVPHQASATLSLHVEVFAPPVSRPQ